MLQEIPVESHPFKPFVPPAARLLLIGTFPGWQLTQKQPSKLGAQDWYYGTARRSLWHLLEQVYERPLPTVEAKRQLLTQLRMEITDVVATARRRKASSSDGDLFDVTYQTGTLAALLPQHAFETLLFSSQLAQKWFNALKPQLTSAFGLPARCLGLPQVVLPSPSPAYSRFGHGTPAERLAAYRRILPLLS